MARFQHPTVTADFQNHELRTWLADTHTSRSTFLCRRFSVEVHNVTGCFVITAWWKQVVVGILDLAKWKSVTASDLRTILLSYTGTSCTVDVKVGY